MPRRARTALVLASVALAALLGVAQAQAAPSLASIRIARAASLVSPDVVEVKVTVACAKGYSVSWAELVITEHGTSGEWGFAGEQTQPGGLWMCDGRSHSYTHSLGSLYDRYEPGSATVSASLELVAPDGTPVPHATSAVGTTRIRA